TYAISKVCGGRIARGLVRRFSSDIYVLRIGRVVTPDEYKSPMFDAYFKNADELKVHGWSYIGARDLVKMCGLAIEENGLGIQSFNAVDEITNYATSTAEFLVEFVETPLSLDR